MRNHNQQEFTSGFAFPFIHAGLKLRTLLVAFAIILPVLVAIGPATAAAADCSTLLGLKLKDTVITEATVVSAKGDVPEYCRVQGGLETVILFEVALPTKGWNNKFFYVGGGGYNGSVPELH